MNAVRQVRKDLKRRSATDWFRHDLRGRWQLTWLTVAQAFTKIKKMMYAEPQTLHLLLNKLADTFIEYLNAQIKAGAQSVIVFDTWGGVLTPRDCISHCSTCTKL